MGIVAVLLLSFLSALPSAQAEEAKVLPAGIRRVRLVGVAATSVADKFNSAGELANLGGANRSVTIKEMAVSDRTGRLGQLVRGLNGLQSGLGDNLYTANLYQDISMRQNIYGAAIEAGISKKITVGVRFRVIERNLKTRFRVDSVNNAPAVASVLAMNAEPPEDLVGGLASVGQFDQGFWEDALFRSKGYDVPANFSKTQLGYTELGVKYEFLRSELLTTSALLGLRVPTGKDPSLTNLLDQGTGGNYWGVGLQGFQEVYPLTWLTLGVAAKYEYYLADTKTRAVPRDENDALPSLLPQDGQVQDVRRRTGGKFDSELYANFQVLEAVSTWAAHQFNNKAGDIYSGPGNLYYTGLGKDTNYVSHAFEAGVEYSTIPAYRRGTFALPMQIALLYNRTFAGTNTPNTTYARMDWKVYF